MTISRNEIIRMAREAGVNTEPDIMVVMERFAARVAAAEREACEDLCSEYEHPGQIANAIRARAAAAIGEKAPT